MIRRLFLTAISAASLGACDRLDSLESQSGWAEDQASANLEEINSLRNRVIDLEAEIERIDARRAADMDFVAAIYDVQKSHIANYDDNTGRLFKNDEVWRSNLNYLRSLHGAPPIPGPTNN